MFYYDEEEDKETTRRLIIFGCLTLVLMIACYIYIDQLDLDDSFTVFVFLGGLSWFWTLMGVIVSLGQKVELIKKKREEERRKESKNSKNSKGPSPYELKMAEFKKQRMTCPQCGYYPLEVIKGKETQKDVTRYIKHIFRGDSREDYRVINVTSELQHGVEVSWTDTHSCPKCGYKKYIPQIESSWDGPSKIDEIVH